MRRPTERRAPAPAHQPLADEIVDRDQVPGRRRGGDDPPDFLGELWRHPLVGIDLENPLAAAGVDPGMPARPLALPRALDQAIGKAERDVARAVTAAVEHDDDLVGEPEAATGIGRADAPRHGRRRAPRAAPGSRRVARDPGHRGGARPSRRRRPRAHPSGCRWCGGRSPGRTSSLAGRPTQRRRCAGPRAHIGGSGSGRTGPASACRRPRRCASARCRCR